MSQQTYHDRTEVLFLKKFLQLQEPNGITDVPCAADYQAPFGEKGGEELQKVRDEKGRDVQETRDESRQEVCNELQGIRRRSRQYDICE